MADCFASEKWEELPERERATAMSSSLMMCQFDWRTVQFPEALSVDVAAPAKHQRVCEELQVVGSRSYGDALGKPVEIGPPKSGREELLSQKNGGVPRVKRLGPAGSELSLKEVFVKSAQRKV